MSEPVIRLVVPDDLASGLRRVRPFLEMMAGGSGGRFEWTDIAQAIARERYQLWIITEDSADAAAIVTQIIDYPRLRACRFIGATGTGLRRWVKLHDTIRTWARGQGCERMEAVGRIGWQRVLRTFGYRPFHIWLEGSV